jgi:uncharacterized protein YbaP (TraB family)
VRRIVVVLLIALGACKSKPAPSSHDEPKAAPPAASLDAAPALPEHNHELALSVCPHARPYLFAVEKGGHRSYLLGTRHVGVGLDRMPPEVADALAHAKLAVFEIAPGDDGDPPDHGAGPSLADALGPAAWARYKALVGDDVAAAVEHEKPSVALILMMSLFEDASASLDQELEDRATRAHLATRGLETSAFQDRLIDEVLDLRALRAAIATTATRDQLRSDTVDDLRDYCAGERMDRSTKDEDDLRKAGYTEDEIARYDDLLLYGRNRAWVPQLEPIFDRGDAFVAVGLDHLLGERGLLAALGKDGYTVARVP